MQNKVLIGKDTDKFGDTGGKQRGVTPDSLSVLSSREVRSCFGVLGGWGWEIGGGVVGTAAVWNGKTSQVGMSNRAAKQL